MLPSCRADVPAEYGSEPARQAANVLKVSGVTFHDLRGTFITERRREGSSIEDIALITGHSIGEVESILERHYLADDQESSDAVILRMEGAMR